MIPYALSLAVNACNVSQWCAVIPKARSDRSSDDVGSLSKSTLLRPSPKAPFDCVLSGLYSTILPEWLLTIPTPRSLVVTTTLYFFSLPNLPNTLPTSPYSVHTTSSKFTHRSISQIETPSITSRDLTFYQQFDIARTFFAQTGKSLSALKLFNPNDCEPRLIHHLHRSSNTATFRNHQNGLEGITWHCCWPSSATKERQSHRPQAFCEASQTV